MFNKKLKYPTYSIITYSHSFLVRFKRTYVPSTSFNPYLQRSKGTDKDKKILNMSVCNLITFFDLHNNDNEIMNCLKSISYPQFFPTFCLNG